MRDSGRLTATPCCFAAKVDKVELSLATSTVGMQHVLESASLCHLELQHCPREYTQSARTPLEPSSHACTPCLCNLYRHCLWRFVSAHACNTVRVYTHAGLHVLCRYVRIHIMSAALFSHGLVRDLQEPRRHRRGWKPKARILQSSGFIIIFTASTFFKPRLRRGVAATTFVFAPGTRNGSPATSARLLSGAAALRKAHSAPCLCTILRSSKDLLQCSSSTASEG